MADGTDGVNAVGDSSLALFETGSGILLWSETADLSCCSLLLRSRFLLFPVFFVVKTFGESDFEASTISPSETFFVLLAPMFVDGARVGLVFCSDRFVWPRIYQAIPTSANAIGSNHHRL